MNNTKKNILIILASLVFAVSPAASSCVLAESADNASSTIISNPESDSALIKRQAIASALDLSVKQITDLKTKLNSLKFTKKSKEIEARKSIISSLDESAGYYSEAKKQLAGKKTADDLRELAKSLRDYREKSYLPVSDKASGFLLVFQTSKLVDTVNSRYSKVDSDLNDLENAGIIEQDQFAEEMTSTKKHIDDALGFLEKAKKTLLEPTPDAADANTEDSALIAPADNTVADGKDISVSPTPREMAEAAITNLKYSYDSLIKISASAKKIAGAK